MALVRSLVATHTMLSLLPVSFALSLMSLSLTPSFISLVFLLTSLLLYTRGIHSHQISKGILLWLTLTAGISFSHLAPSIHALSTPSTSILVLIMLSGISSMIALIPIYASKRVETLGHVQGIIFPSLWATVWLLVSRTSPIGRLITWTPLSGTSSYHWISPFLGFAGIDWITAAWASVAAEVLGSVIFTAPEAGQTLIGDEFTSSETRKPIAKSSRNLTTMTGFLLALTVPSFFISTLPLPPVSPSTTPLRVACILPLPSEESQLDRFIEETRRQTNLAKVLLWPESAVTFETESEKNHALERVLNLTSAQKTWIGVSFEERVSGTGTGRDGLRRNGMTLVGPEGVEMTYYKRKLVPIAESFSQITSSEPPPIHTIVLPSNKRTIPLSASICLDFSVPLTSLDSRPALVLAPAKTWHTGVGRAMYELARARGDEIGADVLWCDGGAGGLSGVDGNMQVGTGSWVKTIGVPYPFPEGQRRTVYGASGDWLAFAVVFGIPALILATQRNAEGMERHGEIAIAWTKGRIGEIVARIRGQSHRRAIAPAPQNESLIDAN